MAERAAMGDASAGPQGRIGGELGFGVVATDQGGE